MVDARSATNEQNVRKLFEYMNQGQLGRLAEVIADDYVGASSEQGPAGFGAVVERLCKGVPDLHYELEEVVAKGDQVAVRWTWSGNA